MGTPVPSELARRNGEEPFGADGDSGWADAEPELCDPAVSADAAGIAPPTPAPTPNAIANRPTLPT